MGVVIYLVGVLITWIVICTWSNWEDRNCIRVKDMFSPNDRYMYGAFDCVELWIFPACLLWGATLGIFVCYWCGFGVFKLCGYTHKHSQWMDDIFKCVSEIWDSNVYCKGGE